MAPELTEKTRYYQSNPYVPPLRLARGVEAYLTQEHGMISQLFRTHNGVVVQTKKKEDWKKYLLLDNALQIEIAQEETGVRATVGGGKWISKAVAAGAGAILAAPAALVLAGLGAYGLYTLPDKIFGFMDGFLSTDGNSIYVPPYSEDLPFASFQGQGPGAQRPYGQSGPYPDPYPSDSAGAPPRRDDSPYVSPFGAAGAPTQGEGQEAPQYGETEFSCPRCGARTDSLPAGSRFCPKCGERLS
jgi:hypothetical protein